MKNIHDFDQGSAAWHAFRHEHFGASEAAAMLGISKYCSRSDLLRRKATGIEPDVSPSLRAVFDRGHATEIGGREMAVKIIGQHLFPHTVSEGKLSASCDGITRDHKIAFEHKQYNATLADSVRAGVLPPEYQPQCQQVMMVTGAEKLLFMVSDGTFDNCAHMWIEPDSEWRQTIVQGWTQFAIDLENYQHTEATVAPVAATIEALPALMIQVEGKVLATNLDQFKASAQKFIDNINTDLQTDQDFADADKMVKFLKDGEERLALCKSQALAQTASIDELFRTIDAISGQMKDKRLMLDRLVKSEKEHRRADIVATAQAELVSHIGRLNERIGGRWMPIIGSPAFPSTMFGEVIKGLKSLDSMRDKVSAALANAKIEASEIADTIAANRLEMIGELDWSFLFPDFAAVCTKARDDFNALLMARIAKHNEAEAARIATAKTAEEARIAAAVDAERKAGEARVERARQEAAKADAGVGLSQDDRAQPEAASTAPQYNATVVEHNIPRAVHHIDEKRIDDFLGLLPIPPMEKKTLRVNLVKWEKYRVACGHEAMAGVA